MQGILRSDAPLAADCVLLIEIAMGLALIAGTILARYQRYRAHAWCQSAVVLLNLLVIAFFMAPSYGRSVAPGLFKHLGRSYYWLATAHGVLGISAELLGLYILLVAGTNVLPQRYRFTRYKPWMRSALALWWLALLLGMATYVRWYGVPFHPTPTRPADSEDRARVHPHNDSNGVTLAGTRSGNAILDVKRSLLSLGHPF